MAENKKKNKEPSFAETLERVFKCKTTASEKIVKLAKERDFVYDRIQETNQELEKTDEEEEQEEEQNSYKEEEQKKYSVTQKNSLEKYYEGFAGNHHYLADAVSGKSAGRNCDRRINLSVGWSWKDGSRCYLHA